MDYRVNPESGCFTVPTVLTDRHLKLAGAVQLKVILWIFRHLGENYEVNDIAAAIGQTPADTADALHYWREAGILLPKDENISAGSSPGPMSNQDDLHENKPAPPINPIPIVAPPSPKPTFADVVKRGKESAELRFLFSEAQVKLAKTLSPGDQSTLLWLHDWAGLPVSVILMIIEYAVSEGKTGMGYIEKIALDWAAHEIDCIEKAEIKISEIKASQAVWKKICGIFQIPFRRATKKEQECVLLWIESWRMKDELVAAAYDICVNRTGKLSFAYIHKILERWQEAGITTPAQAAEFDARKPGGTSKMSEKKETSYDLEEYERMMLYAPIVYKKEE